MAISRWLSEATPPVSSGIGCCIPAGCQRGLDEEPRMGFRAGLRSLQDRISTSFQVRWCRSCLAQPPANPTSRTRGKFKLFSAPNTPLICKNPLFFRGEYLKYACSADLPPCALLFYRGLIHPCFCAVKNAGRTAKNTFTGVSWKIAAYWADAYCNARCFISVNSTVAKRLLGEEP